MKPTRLTPLLAAAALASPLAVTAADIVLTPPAAGGVSVTNAAGNTTRFRVADDGVITLPGLTALPVAGTGLCLDAATGRLGTCTLPGGGASGTVTSIVAGTGLTGGTITASGTIAADTTFLQRRVSASCAAGSSIRAIAADGTVTCQANTSGSANAFVQGGSAFGATAVLGSSDAFALHLVQGGVPALRFFTPAGATGPSVVAGNPANLVAPTAAYATIAGGGAVGGQEPVAGFTCTSGGTCYNEVASPGGTIGGGIDNRISTAPLGTIAGGAGNRVTAANGAVGGGVYNLAFETHATVSGGAFNQSSGFAATVSGGLGGVASGDYATIAGGHVNAASGRNSFAAGTYAVASHDNSFVWAAEDVSAGFVTPFASAHAGEFAVRAPGGARFVTGLNAGSPPLRTVRLNPNGEWEFGLNVRQMLNLWGASYGVGVQADTLYQRSNNHYAWYRGGAHDDAMLAPGTLGSALMTLTNGDPGGLPAVTGLARAQSFVSTSDREAKAAFEPVDERGVLEALVAMPVSSWSYRNEGEAIRHIGPTAQDFRAAFGVGYDERTIATVDADGVALAAIKGLAQVVAEKDRRIAELESRARELEAKAARVEALEREWAELKARLR